LGGILWISDSEAGLKTEKLGGAAGRAGECGGDDVGRLLVKERRNSAILSVKKSNVVCKQSAKKRRR